MFRFHGGNFTCVLPTGTEKSRFDSYFAMLWDAAQRGGPDLFLPPEDAAFLPIQEILEELDRTHGRDFSLEALAERYFVSPGCLSAHFRRLVGISPMQYAMQSRLAHARMLLQSTELSMADIARQCGWQDVSNFVRRFRRQFQVTPLQYRKGKRT